MENTDTGASHSTPAKPFLSSSATLHPDTTLQNENLLSPNLPQSPNFYSPKFLEPQNFSFQNPPSPKSFCGRSLSPKALAPSLFQSSSPPYQKLSNPTPPSPKSPVSKSPSSKSSSPNPNSPNPGSPNPQSQKFFSSKLSFPSYIILCLCSSGLLCRFLFGLSRCHASLLFISIGSFHEVKNKVKIVISSLLDCLQQESLYHVYPTGKVSTKCVLLTYLCAPLHTSLYIFLLPYL